MTLIELVVAMVVLAIVMALIGYFAYPVRQAVDVAMRAGLTDVADNALQRIGREVRLALPNSVRVTASGGSAFLEFLPVVTAGRYRADGPAAAGAPCAGGDELSFEGDTCFKSLGELFLATGTSITASDFVVLNNYGEGFDDQNAYRSTNVRRIAALPALGPPARIETVGSFTRALHDSPGRRFYVVLGDNVTGLPRPVTYECSGGALVRRTGYAMTVAQPTSFSGGTAATLATGVAQCSFEYEQNVAPQIGLLTMTLTLFRGSSGGGTESVTLYHSIHVVNIP